MSTGPLLSGLEAGFDLGKVLVINFSNIGASHKILEQSEVFTAFRLAYQTEACVVEE